MIRLSDDLLTWRAVYRQSQQDVADALNVSVKQVSRWERELARPSEDNYNNIRWLISQPPAGWDRTHAEPRA